MFGAPVRILAHGEALMGSRQILLQLPDCSVRARVKVLQVVCFFLLLLRHNLPLLLFFSRFLEHVRYACELVHEVLFPLSRALELLLEIFDLHIVVNEKLLDRHRLTALMLDHLLEFLLQEGFDSVI